MGKAEDVASDDTELELEEPEKVETGDSLKVRQVMDEAVVQAVLEMDYVSRRVLVPPPAAEIAHFACHPSRGRAVAHSNPCCP